MDNCAHGVDARNMCEKCNDIRRFEYMVEDAKDEVKKQEAAVLAAARLRDIRELEPVVDALEKAEALLKERKAAFEKALGGARWEQVY